MRLRRDHVLNRMYTCGYVTRDQLAVALKEPVRYTPQNPFPFESPHLAEMVRQARGRETVLRTTIDRRIQSLAETAIRDGVSRLRAAGVSNGAVVVIENGPAAVRALVGSCDFFSVADQGQVNGATSPRSPGSALKPFIYALALDQGIITPSSVLADVPAVYTGYQPVNYDRLYRGPVTAREALWASLNIPAVVLMGKVGQKKAYCLLKDAGISTLRKDADHYGLSIALGSVDVSLLDLTNAYAALARLGEYRPYRLLETQPVRPGRQVVSQEAAWLVADVLSEMGRMSGKVMSRSEKNRLRMAWKTGTSFGHRDAWTFAYTPEYTVGVWMGNFSGKPANALVGVEAAAPVAARIMERIYGNLSPTWYAVPKGIVTRKVCAVSGMPAKDICAAQRTDYCIQGVSADVPCTVHQLVKAEGEPGQEQVVESWPTALAAWFRAHGQHRGAPPAASDPGLKPKILSPAPRQTYCLADAGASSQKVLLKAACAGDRLYWFVDDTLYRSCSSQDQTFWPLQPGRHKIVCADAAGRSASTVINVQ
jgi:penicillin-binding protein 1C